MIDDDISFIDKQMQMFKCCTIPDTMIIENVIIQCTLKTEKLTSVDVIYCVQPRPETISQIIIIIMMIITSPDESLSVFKFLICTCIHAYMKTYKAPKS